MPSADRRGPVTVVPVGEGDWESYRDLRLEMLLDAPDAFWTQHADVVDWDDEQWRRAAVRILSLQAREGDVDGQPLGTLSLVPRFSPAGEDQPTQQAGDVWVLAVYVRPQARGRGVGDALLRAAERQARDRFDGRRLVLQVYELNDPARALYARHGYEPTGATVDHPRLAGVKELELALPLLP